MCLTYIFAILRKNTQNDIVCNNDKIGCYGQNDENGHNGRYGIALVGIKYGLYGHLIEDEQKSESATKAVCK